MHDKINYLIRLYVVVIHDFICSLFSYIFAAAIILPLSQVVLNIKIFIPIAALSATIGLLISFYLGIYSTNWRLASLIDFIALIKSSGSLFLILLLFAFICHLYYPDIISTIQIRIILIGSILMLGSQATGRIAYRYYHFNKSPSANFKLHHVCIFIGSASEAENALIAVDNNVLKSNISACLLPISKLKPAQVRGRPILGNYSDLEYALKIIEAGGQIVTSLLLGPSILSNKNEAQKIKRIARRLNIKLQKMEAISIGGRSEINFEEFLFRKKRSVDYDHILKFVFKKSIMISGGGGSIGGDIAILAAVQGAAEITLLDISESGLQKRAAEIRAKNDQIKINRIICDVRDRDHIFRIVKLFSPDILIHAAALKHIDLIELNWQEAVRTNIFGTLNILDAADRENIETLVNISTDKAADPVSFLGLTKRAAELLILYRSQVLTLPRRHSVRFGNVIGSSGSVVEVFFAQIAAGGPVTITDKLVNRYFMTRNEAAELVLVTGSLPERSGLYLLDMGEPIYIRDLAVQMIEWAGLHPEEDIEIIEIGLRPGERLTEKLTSVDEYITPTQISGINSVHRTKKIKSIDLPSLLAALEKNNKRRVIEILNQI